jgi:hypothetical protein
MPILHHKTSLTFFRRARIQGISPQPNHHYKSSPCSAVILLISAPSTRAYIGKFPENADTTRDDGLHSLPLELLSIRAACHSYSALPRPWHTIVSTTPLLHKRRDLCTLTPPTFPPNLDLSMPHATATVNGVVVAETDSYEVVDGNIYVLQPCHTPPSILSTTDTTMA